MSESAEKAETKAGGGGVGMMPLMLAMVVAVVAGVGGVGGVMVWLARSGKLPMPALHVTNVVEAAAVKELPKTHLVALEPLLVNLADDGGRSYLRVAITLRVEDVAPVKGAKAEEPAKGKPVNEFEAAERDVALGVLGRETGAELLAADGKEKLKAELNAALKAKVAEAKITDVLFTEFLVQR